MNNSLIRTDVDLQNCIYFQTPIEVWLEGEIEETILIEQFTELSVKTNSGYFLRKSCVFKKAN